jgi:hypothetical protein
MAVFGTNGVVGGNEKVVIINSCHIEKQKARQAFNAPELAFLL